MAEKPPNGTIPLQRVTLTAPAVIGFIGSGILAASTILIGLYKLDQLNSLRVEKAKQEIKADTDAISKRLIMIQEEVADHRHLTARIERMSTRIERLEDYILELERKKSP